MNRSQVPVEQVSLQRPQSPRESGSSLDQVARLTPVPAAVPVSKHASAFMHLYYSLEARRTSMVPLVIQFISPSPKAGVSVTSSGYARVAAEAQAGRVLFVDAACRDPNPADRLSHEATLVDAFQNNDPPGAAIFPARFAKNLFWTRLCEGRGSSLNLGVERIQLLFDSLRRDHSLIVLDCASRMGARGHCIGALLRWLRARCCRRQDLSVGDRVRTPADRKGGWTGRWPGSQPGARPDVTTGRGVLLAVDALPADIAPCAPPDGAPRTGHRRGPRDSAMCSWKRWRAGTRC